MANLKSTTITNFEAVPRVTGHPFHFGGVVRSVRETYAVAAADADGDVIQFFPVHSSWAPTRLDLFNDAITAGTVYDFGLHTTAGVAVDADLFATDVDLSAARVAPLDILHEALNITEGKKRIWEMLALTTDPDIWYYLTATGDTIGTAAGDITLKLSYTDD